MDPVPKTCSIIEIQNLKTVFLGDPKNLVMKNGSNSGDSMGFSGVSIA